MINDKGFDCLKLFNRVVHLIIQVIILYYSEYILLKATVYGSIIGNFTFHLVTVFYWNLVVVILSIKIR